MILHLEEDVANRYYKITKRKTSCGATNNCFLSLTFSHFNLTFISFFHWKWKPFVWSILIKCHLTFWWWFWSTALHFCNHGLAKVFVETFRRLSFLMLFDSLSFVFCRGKFIIKLTSSYHYFDQTLPSIFNQASDIGKLWRLQRKATGYRKVTKAAAKMKRYEAYEENVYVFRNFTFISCFVYK